MEEQSDGSVIVSGLCTSDSIDLDHQIIDLDFSRKGLGEWAATWGNVRQMHSTNLPPAGKAIDVDTTRPEGVYLTARIVEPSAVKLVREGIYSAFSVGISQPRIVRDQVAKNGRVIDGVFSEVSIVDFPALPSAKFEIVKRSKTQVTKIAKSLTPIGEIVKREMDPDVGGGTDRDKISAKDFAGRNRSFPIVTPDDVADAASSIGRAGADNYSSETLKSNIINIARRKGDEFVARLPESWKSENKSMDVDVEKAAECEVCKGAGCEKCGGKMQESELEKAADCKYCKGAGCEKCDGGKMEESELEKGKIPKDDEEVTEDLAEADEAIHEAQAAQAEDNAAHEAGMSEDDEEDEEKKKPVGKTLSLDEASYAIRRAHDATCSAFSRETVETVHPLIAKSIKDALDPSVIEEVLAHSNVDPAKPERLIALANAAGAANAIKTAEVEALVDGRDEMHKAFQDMNPSAHVTPGTVSPGQFRRPFISAGRAPLSGGDGGDGLPTGHNSVEADDFDRGPITDGREKPSPSSEASSERMPASAPAKARMAEAAKNHAAASLSAIHDHITGAYPDLCPMDGGPGRATVAGYADNGRSSLDMSGGMRSVHAGAEPTLTKVEESVETPGTVKAVRTESGEVLIDTAMLTEIVKAIVNEQTVTKFASIDSALEVAQSEIDRMASEPDPTKAPIRGSVVVDRAVTKSASEAVALRSDAELKLQEQVNYLQTLTKSGNPELRMRAERQLAVLMERAAFDGDTTTPISLF